MTGYKSGLKGGMSTKYSTGQSMAKTAQPAIKVGYAAGKKDSTQVRREGDKSSSHGK